MWDSHTHTSRVIILNGSKFNLKEELAIKGVLWSENNEVTRDSLAGAPGGTHSFSHTCTNICMPANTHAWRSPLSQPSSPACGKNTKKTHTCMLANQTEINPDSTVDSDLWNKQWIFGAVFYWNHCTAPFAFIKIPTMHLHDEREARWKTEDQSRIDEVKESLPCDPDVNINTHRADESITVMMTARRSQCSFHSEHKRRYFEESLGAKQLWNQLTYTVWTRNTEHFSDDLLSCTPGILKSGPFLQSLDLNLIKHTWAC